MDTVSIRDEHMLYRCYFMTIMCSVSLYTWSNYSLSTTPINELYTPYYQNCLFFILYLLWDTYKMILSSQRNILFRKDLIIHHIVSLFSYSNFHYKSLQMSNVLIAECMSLMNYKWRHNRQLLNLYRIFCILFIRFPLNFYFIVYHNPVLVYPFTNIKINNTPYAIIFFSYDVHTLWQIYSNNNKNRNKNNKLE